MPLLPLLVVAFIAMAGLAILRVVRVRRGWTPLPEGDGRRPFLAAFVVLPPVILGALSPAAGIGLLQGLLWVPFYALLIGGLALLMWIAAQLVGAVSHGRTAASVRVALTGNPGDPPEVAADSPMTPALAACVAGVDRANAAFPRGPAFAVQIDRSGFRDDWEALDTACRTLEGRIADDRRLGVGVSIAATARATDARSRLDTLQHLAASGGQAWATG